jgi:hypothetical protein
MSLNRGNESQDSLMERIAARQPRKTRGRLIDKSKVRFDKHIAAPPFTGLGSSDQLEFNGPREPRTLFRKYALGRHGSPLRVTKEPQCDPIVFGTTNGANLAPEWAETLFFFGIH